MLSRNQPRLQQTRGLPRLVLYFYLLEQHLKLLRVGGEGEPQGNAPYSPCE